MKQSLWDLCLRDLQLGHRTTNITVFINSKFKITASVLILLTLCINEDSDVGFFQCFK